MTDRPATTSPSPGGTSPSTEALPRWETGTAVMIDDPGTRDLDDAIWATETADGGWSATVHIAATAATVRAGSPADLRARSRIESKYLRNKTIPMLGEHAEQQATLSDTHDRPALTVSMTFDTTATLTAAHVTRSHLPAGSCVRVPYSAVPEILEHPDHKLHTQLTASHTLAKAMLARRTAAGALALYDLIRGYSVTEDGAITRIPTQQRTVGYVIVAELMVATGTALAEWSIDNDLMVLYRNHHTRLLGSNGADLAADIAASLHDPELFEQLRSRVNRTFGRARYDTAPRGHHGLRVGAYTHVTSPLRRYADLVTHRIVWDHLTGAPNPYTRTELDEIAAEINSSADAKKRHTESHFKQQHRIEGAKHILDGQYSTLDSKQWRRMFDLMTKVAPSAGIEAELNRRLAADQLAPNDLTRLAIAGPAWIDIRTRLFRAARRAHPEFGPSIISGRAQILGDSQPEIEVLEAPNRPTHQPLFAVRARSGEAIGTWQFGDTKKSAQAQAMWELLDVLCCGGHCADNPPAWPDTPTIADPPAAMDAPGTPAASAQTSRAAGALPAETVRRLAALSETRRANAFSNPVGWLNSLAAAERLGEVTYSYDIDGPSHAPLFTCTATLAGIECYETSTAKTQSRVAAATGLITALFQTATTSTEAI
ncbi:RNB domain-containing ribonuclease [Mycolicibacterium fortuitum]|uniref:RNB domain-containing ribonuclease n=1 Tax=Mycolicibacterium fortuitum TaxID=1766 RepID=UPI001CDC3290|nr:RNB domain-containing ribonuclease [Mycolicibacterium fortuitum]UBV20404.1 RNB domain-containing ribonuclease [Mycolicibacterium fortuitum]